MLKNLKLSFKFEELNILLQNKHQNLEIHFVCKKLEQIFRCDTRIY